MASRPTVPRLTHGGFLKNRHHQGIEELADETSMGRDTLRQTDNLYPDSIKSEGYREMLNNQPARGGSRQDTVKNSPWAKGK